MRKLLLATTALIGLSAAPASADVIKFYNGGTGYTGPFSGVTGPNTVYKTINTLSQPQSCGANGCTTDTIATPQSYTNTTATASTGAGSKVWTDANPTFGGLGVQGVSDNDNIDGKDLLTITFAQKVQLNGVATLFTDGHGPFGDLANLSDGTLLCSTCETFLLNGVSTRFDLANFGLLNLTGTTFTFAEDLSGNNTSFYVSGLSFTAGQIGGVPEISTWAMMGIGFAFVGLFGMRNNRRMRYV